MLSQKSKDVIFSVSPNVVAYGWKVRKITDERTGKVNPIYITDGLLPGFIAFAVEQVDTKRLVIQLSNVGEMTHKVGDINLALMNILDGKEYSRNSRSRRHSLQP